MKYRQFFLFLTLFLVGAGVFSVYKSKGRIQKSLDKAKGNTNAVSVSSVEFNELAENPESFLLDVHIPEQTHIPGTDAFIPYNEIGKNLSKLPKDKNTPLLIYCRSGSMSKEAASELKSLGYTQVYDLEGGVNAYKEANVRVEINPDQKDLGTVVYGDIARTEFTLTNFSPVPLAVIRVSTSCSCTGAKVEKEKLTAYEATKVEVSFNPAVHGDDTDLGDVTRTIYIDTDNPNFPQVTTQIIAKVIKKVGD